MTKTTASGAKAATASTKAAGKTAAGKVVSKTAREPDTAASTPSTKSSSRPSKASTPQVPDGTAEAVVQQVTRPAARPPAKKSSPAPENMPPTATKVDTKLANAWKQKAGRDLTETELLAMPDAEYMSDKQLDFFRARLESQKEDLLSNAGETTEHLREDTSIVPDPADRATIEEEHALELRTRDRERKLLKKISQALARIEAGDYGFCDETGEPIGLGRLLARPTATLSLEAQQRRELKQKMFGD